MLTALRSMKRRLEPATGFDPCWDDSSVAPITARTSYSSLSCCSAVSTSSRNRLCAVSTPLPYGVSSPPPCGDTWHPAQLLYPSRIIVGRAHDDDAVSTNASSKNGMANQWGFDCCDVMTMASLGCFGACVHMPWPPYTAR